MKDFFLYLLKSVWNIDFDALSLDLQKSQDDIARQQRQNQSLSQRMLVLQQEKNAIAEKLATAQEAIGTLQSKKEQDENKLNRVQQELTQTKNKQSDVKKELTIANDKLQRQVQTLSENIRGLQQEKEDLQTTNQCMVRALTSASITISSLQSQLKDGEDKLNHIQEELIRTKEGKEKIEKELASVKEELKSSENAVELVVSPQEQIQDQIDNLKLQYQELKGKYKAISIEKNKLSGDLANHKATIESLYKIQTEKDKEIKKQKQQIEELLLQVGNSGNTSSEKRNDAPATPITLLTGKGVEIDAPDLGENEKAIEEAFHNGIPVVVDVETNKEIEAQSFFKQPEGYLYKMRSELEKAIVLERPKYVCKYCGQMVRISGEKFKRGVAWKFSHIKDTDDCSYKTTTGMTKREINREKFSRCNEGNRHRELKMKIANLLAQTPNIMDVKVESTVKAVSHPILKWRRPDIQANYRGQDIVIELQLSTTFVSVMVERNMFYRMEHKHIIWVFNFDDQAEHVDLTNMVVRDSYYNNHMSIFLFDHEAQAKSEEKNELYLKCNWLTPTVNGVKWAYPNGNTSDQIGGELIRLSDLKFDTTYQPYYYLADEAFFAAHPELKKKEISIDKENEEIINDLNKKWEKEQVEKQNAEQSLEDKKQRIIDDYQIEKEVKSTKTILIGQSNGKVGLVSIEDGVIRIPFKYNGITTHRTVFDKRSPHGWTEAEVDSITDVYDAHFNITVSRILRMEDFSGKLKKYLKKIGENLLWGILGGQGEKLTDAKYSQIELWSQDKFIAMRDGKYCILGDNGKELVYGFDYIGPLNNDNIAEIRKNERRGLINGNCRNIRTATESLQNGYMKVCIGDRWGIEDGEGNELIACSYDDVGSYRGVMVQLDGENFSITDKTLPVDCPLNVSYKFTNERNMMIFSVGQRLAFMNLRQRQKAMKKGINPKAMKKAYISFANSERNLLYLSAIPVKSLSQATKEVKDSDMAVGTMFEGEVSHMDNMSIIIKSSDGKTAYIHKNILGELSLSEFHKGQKLKVEKTGFDAIHKKHIWKILAN